MKKRPLYLVTEYEENRISVYPISESASNSYSQQENSHSKGFCVTNPQGFPIKKGSLVYVALSKQIKIILGFLVLFTPVIAAFAGYFLSIPFYNFLNIEITEKMKFFSSLGLFLFSSIIEIALTRNTKTILTPMIIGVKS